MAQCTARSKQTGKRCRRNACPGADTCPSHGGKGSGRPIVTGRWSKFAPVRIASTIEQGLQDPELISLRNQMAYLDSLALSHLQDLGSETPARQWEGVLRSLDGFPDLIARFEDSIGPLATDDVKASIAGMRAWHERITEALKQGSQSEKAETEIRTIIQEQTKVARQETRRERVEQQGVSERRLQYAIAIILHSIQTHVPDVAARRAIQTDLVRAIGPGDS